MQTVRLTTAQAIVKYLIAQRIEIDGVEEPLFPGVFAIFGHGNVTCLGQALEEAKDELPTWRGQNEQGMALAATAFAKAKRRRQIMIATSSIGPGATNMVTAAGVAHANRLPLLLMAGDTFAQPRARPCPAAGRAFRRPLGERQRLVPAGHPLLGSHHAPRADRALAPARRRHDARPGHMRAGLSRVAAGRPGRRVRLPRTLLRPNRSHHRSSPGRQGSARLAAARVLAGARKPVIIAGGGVHYSFAEAELTAFAERHNIPVVETVAGRATLTAAHPLNAGPIGVTGCTSANALASEADVVVAVGTRLQDFTTGSWTLFRDETVQFVGINAARFRRGEAPRPSGGGRRPRDAPRTRRPARRLAERR